MENNNIDIKKRDKLRLIKFTLITIGAAIVSALAMHVFIYPADFVPLGLEAIVTMLQDITKINAGWFNLLFNLPLIILALIKLKKSYAIFTLLFTFVSSGFLILFETINFPQYVHPNERLLASIFAGMMLGVRTGLMMRIGSSTGGVDIIAKMINPKFPHVNTERIISIFCAIVICLSYFCYQDFNCILLGFVQMFISEKATTFLMKDNREAVKIEIVTKEPEKIRDDIITNLRHSATIINSKGMFSGEQNSIVVVILNLYQMADFISIIKKYPDVFVYYHEVKGVKGNFRRFKDEEVK